jgi:hypothetical protein
MNWPSLKNKKSGTVRNESRIKWLKTRKPRRNVLMLRLSECSPRKKSSKLRRDRLHTAEKLFKKHKGRSAIKLLNVRRY